MAILTPYLQYWEEIRRRVAWCLLFFVLVFSLALSHTDTLFGWMLTWARQHQRSPTPMVVFSVWDGFQASIHLAAYVALVSTLPLMVWELYSFVAPALYEGERRVIAYFALLGLVLFYLGGYMAGCYVLPWLLYALPLWLPSQALWVLEVTGFTRLVVVCVGYGGLVAQLPAILGALCYFGYCDYMRLVALRGYVWLGAFVLGMLLTPPDMFLQLLVALPLCVLYEIMLFGLWVNGLRRMPLRDI